MDRKGLEQMAELDRVEGAPAILETLAEYQELSDKNFVVQYTSHKLIVQKGRYVVRGDSEFDIPPLSFALLDAVFSPDALCLSEPGNALRSSEAVRNSINRSQER